MALISQGGVVMLNRVEDSFIDASGFFLDLELLMPIAFASAKSLSANSLTEMISAPMVSGTLAEIHLGRKLVPRPLNQSPPRNALNA
ncbi:hypothetical protein [Mesorhizobium caraganae]|uniref:hypothetical protein n=1 Tax=Mesorhizobium caraganae TaxID=483206 RepID=UPI00333A1539